jgi:Ca2+-binding RTX toxin-like protein
MDVLENRRLFSSTVAIIRAVGEQPTTTYLQASVVTTYKVSKTGTLFLSGTSKADDLTLQVKNGKLVNGNFFTYAPSASTPKIKRIDLTALGGNDDITVVADVPVSVRGAAGKDTLKVFAPTRTIVGGTGADTITEGDEAAGNAYLKSTGVLVSATGASTHTDGDNIELTRDVRYYYYAAQAYVGK